MLLLKTLLLTALLCLGASAQNAQTFPFRVQIHEFTSVDDCDSLSYKEQKVGSWQVRDTNCHTTDAPFSVFSLSKEQYVRILFCSLGDWDWCFVSFVTRRATEAKF